MDLITFRYIETEPPLPRRSLIKSAHFSLAVSTLICVCVCVLSLLPHLPSSFVPPSSGVYTMESISIISEFYFLKKRRKKKSNTQEKVIVFDIYIFSILYTRKKKKKNKKKNIWFLIEKERERYEVVLAVTLGQRRRIGTRCLVYTDALLPFGRPTTDSGYIPNK